MCFSHVQISERTLSLLISILMDQEKVVVGIDLGTTTSCAFVQCHGKLENVVRQGNRNTIDSVIKFTPKGACVLDVITAARAAQLKGKRCVYEAKRLIGRKYEEVNEEVKKNQWPFEVFEGKDGYAAIRVTMRYRGNDGQFMEEKRELYPEEVSSYILRDLKERAEKLLDCSIDSCVIGCPVDFNLDQRKRTVEAAVMAGFKLNNISLYPESTLAAIAYAEEYDREATKPRVYLVYDFGGGTFDVSIVRRNESKYEVVATEGDENCGGKDIDARLMSVIREDLEDDGYMINENRLSKMKYACKQMKELLLTNLSYEMCCDFVKLDNEDEDDYPVKRMTSAAVDAIAKPVIDHTLDIVIRLLKKSSYTPDRIDYVFMTGGSSKLNGVKASLERVFGAEKVKCDTACLCEVAIAKGVALMALNKVLPVEVVDRPPIHPIVPPPHVVNPIPVFVVIKIPDGEVELVPEGASLNYHFRNYVFPSPTSNSAVIEYGVRDGDALRSVGHITIPMESQKDAKVQPMFIEPRVEGSGTMNVCVMKQVDNIDYTVTINLSMNEEGKKEQTVMQELRDAIQAVYDEERYGGKLDNRAKRKEWLAVAKQSQHCNSVEELEVLKERMEKLKSEL